MAGGAWMEVVGTCGRGWECVGAWLRLILGLMRCCLPVCLMARQARTARHRIVNDLHPPPHTHTHLCARAGTGTASNTASITASTTPSPLYAYFRPENMVVLRVGTPGGLLGTGWQPVAIDEIEVVNGIIVNSLPIPGVAAGANNPCRLLGSDGPDLDGHLARSLGGKTLQFGCRGTSTPGAAGSTVPGVIARVLATGAVSTSTTVGMNAAVTSVVTSTGLAGFWSSVRGGGVMYTPSLGTASSTAVSTTFTDVTWMDAYMGQLYALSQGAPAGVSSVGSGIPTLPGTLQTKLIGFDAPSNRVLRGVAFKSTSIMFVTDLRNSSVNAYEYRFSTGAWREFKPIICARGVSLPYITSRTEAAVFTVYLSGPTAVYRLNTVTYACKLVVRAPAGTQFRGIAPAPSDGSLWLQSPSTTPTGESVSQRSGRWAQCIASGLASLCRHTDGHHHAQPDAVQHPDPHTDDELDTESHADAQHHAVQHADAVRHAHADVDPDR